MRINAVISLRTFLIEKTYGICNNRYATSSITITLREKEGNLRFNAVLSCRGLWMVSQPRAVSCPLILII